MQQSRAKIADDKRYQTIVRSLSKLSRSIGANYQVREMIGFGPHSVVIQATDGQKTYAVKLLLPSEYREYSLAQQMKKSTSPDLLDREYTKLENKLNRESEELVLLRGCEYIVNYVTHGWEDVEESIYPLRVFYLMTEYVPGMDLDQFCQNRKAPIPLHLCLDIATQVLKGIDFATTRVPGTLIIHRDIKPSNLRITSQEGEDRHEVKIIDYGLAKVYRFDRTDNSTLSYYRTNHGYMPPEVWFGGDLPNPCIDTYSVGIILLELLLAYHPKPMSSNGERYDIGDVQKSLADLREKRVNKSKLPGAHASVLNDHLNALPSVPEGLRAILSKATSFHYKKRADASTIMQQLIAIQRDVLSQKAREALQLQEPDYLAATKCFRQATYWDAPVDYNFWKDYADASYKLNNFRGALNFLDKAAAIIESRLKDSPSLEETQDLRRNYIEVRKSRGMLASLLAVAADSEEITGGFRQGAIADLKFIRPSVTNPEEQKKIQRVLSILEEPLAASKKPSDKKGIQSILSIPGKLLKGPQNNPRPGTP